MGVLVDDLLLLARLDQGRPLEAEPVDLVAVAATRGRRPGRRARRPIALHCRGARVVAATSPGCARWRQPAGQRPSAHARPTAGRRAGRVGGRGTTDSHHRGGRQGPGLAGEDRTGLRAVLPRRPSRARHGAAGAGLGLSIVAAVASAHGGRAAVESGPGHGARFRVELPARRGTLEPNRRRTPHPPLRRAHGSGPVLVESSRGSKASSSRVARVVRVSPRRRLPRLPVDRTGGRSSAPACSA